MQLFPIFNCKSVVHIHYFKRGFNKIYPTLTRTGFIMGHFSDNLRRTVWVGNSSCAENTAAVVSELVSGALLVRHPEARAARHRRRALGGRWNPGLAILRKTRVQKGPLLVPITALSRDCRSGARVSTKERRMRSGQLKHVPVESVWMDRQSGSAHRWMWVAKAHFIGCIQHFNVPTFTEELMVFDQRVIRRKERASGEFGLQRSPCCILYAPGARQSFLRALSYGEWARDYRLSSSALPITINHSRLAELTIALQLIAGSKRLLVKRFNQWSWAVTEARSDAHAAFSHISSRASVALTRNHSLPRGISSSSNWDRGNIIPRKESKRGKI